MQTYKIELPQSVKDIIQEQALVIALDKPQVAFDWYEDIFEKIDTLNALPERCPTAPESQYFDFEVRHLLIGNYRVLFRVLGEIVVVLDFKGGKQYKPD